MKTIARIGMAAACVALIAAGTSPASGQSEPIVPQSQYQNYPPQNQAAPNSLPQYQQPGAAPVGQQYPGQQSLGPPVAAPQQAIVPQSPPPFILTPQEQADLDKALDEWERQSMGVTTFKCEFKHWKYDPTFLPPTLDATGNLVEKPIEYTTGKIKYKAPDKGLIETDEVWEVKDPGTPAQKSVKRDYGEHWICDGKMLYAIDHEKKEIHRTKLPPEMQGNLITEGPLPFAFGTKAGPLKARYYLRVVTPPNDPKEVWLEIRPRTQRDLTNFVEVEVILRTSDMRPTAIQITHAEVKVPIQTPQGQKIVAARQREVYQFDEKWFFPSFILGDFAPPFVGFTTIDEKVPGTTVPPPANNSQARRQWPPVGNSRPY